MNVWTTALVIGTSLLSIALMSVLVIYMKLMYTLQRGYREMHARTLKCIEDIETALTRLGSQDPPSNT